MEEEENIAEITCNTNSSASNKPDKNVALVDSGTINHFMMPDKSVYNIKEAENLIEINMPSGTIEKVLICVPSESPTYSRS